MVKIRRCEQHLCTHTGRSASLSASFIGKLFITPDLTIFPWNGEAPARDQPRPPVRSRQAPAL